MGNNYEARMQHTSALYDPIRTATPSQRLAAAAHNMRRAKIASRALPENHAPRVVTFEIPNTPFGVAKVRPYQPEKKPESAPVYRMWFEGLIAEADRQFRKTRVPDILKATALHFGVSVAELTRGGRTKPLVTCRHIAMYLATVLTDYSLPDIGRRFGGFDHTTIINGRDRIKHLIKYDVEIAAHVKAIISSIPGAQVRNG
jgi:hypothetical protein